MCAFFIGRSIKGEMGVGGGGGRGGKSALFGYNGEITRHEPLNSKVRVTKTKRNEEKLMQNAADFEKKTVQTVQERKRP